MKTVMRLIKKVPTSVWLTATLVWVIDYAFIPKLHNWWIFGFVCAYVICTGVSVYNWAVNKTSNKGSGQ